MAASPNLFRRTFQVLQMYEGDRNQGQLENGQFHQYIHDPKNSTSLFEIRNELVRIANANQASTIFDGGELSSSFNPEGFDEKIKQFNNAFYRTFEQAVWTNNWKLIDPTFKEEGKPAPVARQQPAPVQASIESTKPLTVEKAVNTPVKAPPVEAPRVPSREVVREKEIIPRGTAQEGTAATNKQSFSTDKTAGLQGQESSTPSQVLDQAPAAPQPSRASSPVSRRSYSPGGGLRRVGGELGNFGKNVGSKAAIGVRQGLARLPGAVSGSLPGGLGGIFSRPANVLSNLARGGGGIPGFGGKFSPGSKLPGRAGGAGNGGLRAGQGFSKKSWGWRIFWVVLILFILIGLFSGLFPNSDQENLTVKVAKVGPEQVDNGGKIDYTITVSNLADKASEVQLTDNLPSGVEFVEANLKPDNKNGNRIVWFLKDVPAQGTKTVRLTVKATDAVNDSWIQNNVEAIAMGTGGGGIPPGGNEPANGETCSGKLKDFPGGYTLKSPIGNFGDPSCNFDKDKLFELIKQNEPDLEAAKFWFYTIVRCETGGSYNPNSWRDPNITPKTPDPAGAWGLYQMGRGRNGQYDRGDVPWQQQTTNAINYKNNVSKSFGYWACASI